MVFEQALQSFLLKKGFRRLEHHTRILWVKDQETYLALVDIIPERLPGQPEISIREKEEEIRQIERDIMIRSGRKVERLTLMICRDLPEQTRIREMINYPDIWWVDRKNAEILIFERQRPDFSGLKKELEEFLIRWDEGEKRRNHLELKRMLQPVTMAIVSINILVFLALYISGHGDDGNYIGRLGALSWTDVILNGQYYRLFAAMFLHFGAEHLLQNMMVLLLTGTRLERAVGKIRYLIIYLASGIAASVASLFFTLRGTGDIAAGASGAIFGIMGGMICLIIKDTLGKRRSYMKEIGLTGVIFMAVCAASYGFVNPGIDNAAHLGGLACGFLLTFIITPGS